MSVVIDANVLAALALDDERAPAITAFLEEHPEDLHAPDLLRYEVANALTRSIAAGLYPRDRLPAAWARLQQIGVTLHRLDDGIDTVDIALRLRRTSAYDAAYLTLAQRLDTELWTLDGPLARNAQGLGMPVTLIV